MRDQVRDRLPIAFEDLGEHEVAHIVRPVRVFRVVLAAPQAAAADAGAARRTAAAPAPERPPPERPAVAVLPFQNLGGDADAEFFLDSVAEDLITELARARWFSVVARNTSFSYKHKGADAKQLARELGVRYVVEGSLRKAGNRVRVSCQLVEAASGQHLWADRFDGTLEDSFDLQDKITESAIGSVAPVLRLAEIERARRKPQASLDVYDLTLRALPPAFAETAADNQTALQLLAEALATDPGYPTANALAAWCRQQRHLMNWPGAQPDDREEAKRFARLAIDGGADVPLALAVAGAVRAALTRDHDLALAAVDRAAMMNPNAAIVLGFDAVTRCLCGHYPRAIEHAEKALHLSPLEPLVYHAAFALALAPSADRAGPRRRWSTRATRSQATATSLFLTVSWLWARPVSAVPRRRRRRCAGWRRSPPAFTSVAAQHPVCRRGTAPARSRSAARGTSARVTAKRSRARTVRTPIACISRAAALLTFYQSHACVSWLTR